jgi:hypothetical protein
VRTLQSTHSPASTAQPSPTHGRSIFTAVFASTIAVVRIVVVAAVELSARVSEPWGILAEQHRALALELDDGGRGNSTWLDNEGVDWGVRSPKQMNGVSLSCFLARTAWNATPMLLLYRCYAVAMLCMLKLNARMRRRVPVLHCKRALLRYAVPWVV